MTVSESGSVPRNALPKITVTQQDWRRLTSMMTASRIRWPEHARSALRAELARATLVPSDAITPDIVTMNSRVRFEVAGVGRWERTLVYPWDADDAAERLSVLAPLGSALLGLSAGDSIRWPLVDGTTIDVRLLEVVYQPEAAGNQWL